MMQQQMNQLQANQASQRQLAAMPSNPNIMLPSTDLPMTYKQKTGTNNDMNTLLQQLNEDQLIPVLPEMQQMFDMNQLEMQQQQAYQRGQLPMDNYGGQPQIMDQSIVNMARNGKLPMPLLSGFQMSPGMNSGMSSGLGSGLGSVLGSGMDMNTPLVGNMFESGVQENNEQMPINKETQNDKLTGGYKNYFLKKKH
jgi:hypothetical protein